MSSKIAPSCSLQTASSIRGDLRLPPVWARGSVRDLTADTEEGAVKSSTYTVLPSSPDASEHKTSSLSPRRWWCARVWPRSLVTWLYKCPQMWFLLLFVCCTYASGLHASFHVAQWVLDRVQVPEAMAVAQHTYAQSNLQLQNASSCVIDTTFMHLAGVKADIEAFRQHSRDAARKNANVLDELADRVAQCSGRLFEVLNVSNARPNQINSHPEARTSATTKCFADAFNSHQSRWSESNSSRELLDHVRATLLVQAAAESIEALDQPAQQLDGLDDSTGSHDAIKMIFAAALRASATGAQLAWYNLSTAHESTDRDSLDGNKATDSENIPANVDKFSLIEALDDPDLRATDALLHLKAVLQKALLSVVPFENALFDTIMNASEWKALETSVDSLQKLSLGFQQELEIILTATQTHLNRSMTATKEILERAESQIISSVDFRDRQWNTVMQSILASHERSARTAGEKIRTLAEALGMKEPNLVTRSHCRDLTFGNHSDIDDLARHELALTQRRDDLRSRAAAMHTLNSTSGNDDAALVVEPTSGRVRELHTALIRVWRTTEWLMYLVDWGSVCVKILEVMFALWTDSYSVISPIDIRGISSLLTLSDAWKFFLCRLDFTSLCYFVLMQLDALLQTLVEYFAWVCAGVVGTAIFVMWKRDYLKICGNNAPDDNISGDSQTVVQQLLSFVLPIRASARNPMTEMSNQSALVASLVERELRQITIASAQAWRNQSAVLDHLQSQQSTIASLTRMYDDCVVAESVHGGDIDISDACSSLDLRTGSTLLQHFSSPPTELLASSNSSSLSYDHCFQDDLLRTASGMQVREMHRGQACAAERGVYLVVASWWLFCIVWSTNRFVAKMVVKAFGVLWWRFLSANRLEFIGFCFEDGAIQSPESLSKAIRKHLRDVRWLAVFRLLTAGLMICVCTGIWHLVLHRML